MKPFIYSICLLIGLAPVSAFAADSPLEIKHSICATSGDGFVAHTPFQVTAGDDVAGMALTLDIGNLVLEEDDYLLYNVEGTMIPAMMLSAIKNMSLPNESVTYGSHRWTFVCRAYNQENNLLGGTTKTVFVPEKSSDWEDYAEAEFTDLFFGDKRDTGGTYSVIVQRNKSNPGRLRIVNPYKDVDGIGETDRVAICRSHDHYIYINAEDPEFVFVEESAAGMDFGNGEVMVSSTIGSKLNLRTIEDVADIYLHPADRIAEMKGSGISAGRLMDNQIIFPAGVLAFGETEHDNLALQNAGEGCLLRLTNTGVESILEDGSQPVIYFDLNGVQISQPSEPGLYIKKQGSKIWKICEY